MKSAGLQALGAAVMRPAQMVYGNPALEIAQMNLFGEKFARLGLIAGAGRCRPRSASRLRFWRSRVAAVKAVLPIPVHVVRRVMPHAYIAKVHGLVDTPPSSFEQAIRALEEFASVKCYSRGQEIFGDYGEQKYLYRVRAGVVRKFALQPGGRRHILELLLPGDFFGFGGGQEYLAEAAVDRTLV
jgi:hypothetical protein